MKIEGTSSTTSTSKTSKTRKKGDGSVDFGSMVEEAAQAESSAPARAPSSLGALDALLAVQEDGRRGSREANKRAKQHAAELLDQLDSIKMGILHGSIPKSDLQQLSHIISRRRDSEIDPQLAEILDEIDLRAQVELAKLDR